MDLHAMRIPEYKNHIFNIWSMYMYVCYQHNSEANQHQNEQQTWYSTFLSYTNYIWNFLWRSGNNTVHRGTKNNSNTLRPMELISCY